MLNFNQNVINDPNVRYYSFAARVKSPPALLALPFKIVSEKEGENDGIVSVESSKWNEFQGTLEASHFDLVHVWNRFNHTNFDALDFYSKWVQSLALKGH